MRASIKFLILSAALAGAGSLAYPPAETPRQSAAPVAAQKPAAPRETPAATPGQSAAGPTLPERSGLGEATSPLFSSQSWEPPPPKVKPGPPAPPPKPVAPPLPYTFAGRMLQDGTVYVFLARGDSVITAKQGDVIDNTWRVDSITESQVTLEYIALKQKQSLAVVSSLPRALAPFDVRQAPAVPARADNAPPTSLR